MAERQQVDQMHDKSGAHKQPRGHPKRHWWDNINEAIGPNWSDVAKDQCCWTESREGFLQQQ